MTVDRLVNILLENEDDPDAFSMDYFMSAQTWHEIDLIPSREWRSLFTRLGWRVKRFYRHKSKPEFRYGLFTIDLVPKDGHAVDWQDEALVRDYTYEFLEKKFGKERSQIGIVVESSAYGLGPGAFPGDDPAAQQKYPEYCKDNQVVLRVREEDGQDRYQWQYLR